MTFSNINYISIFSGIYKELEVKYFCKLKLTRCIGRRRLGVAVRHLQNVCELMYGIVYIVLNDLNTTNRQLQLNCSEKFNQMVEADKDRNDGDQLFRLSLGVGIDLTAQGVKVTRCILIYWHNTER